MSLTLEPDAKLCRLLLLPPELREMIWNELSRQSLVDASRTCNAIRGDCAKQLCEHVGRGWTPAFVLNSIDTDVTTWRDDLPGGLAYYHKFRNSTRALCLERKVMNCPEAMATVFDMYRGVALHHVLALDNTMWSSSACKPLKSFLGAQHNLQTACIPVVGSADVQAILNSIIRIKVPGMKDKKHLYIIINKYCDVDIVKGLMDRPGTEVKDIALFGSQFQGATIEAWADTLTHQGLVSPCNVSRIWLHLCNLTSLSRHLNKDVIESLGVFNCAYDASAAQAMNAFISDFLDEKKAMKNTTLKEFIYTNFINDRDADEAHGITDANLCKLAEIVTDVVALTVQKHTPSDLDLTQVVYRWNETLRAVAWNMNGKPLGFNTIRQLGISIPKLEALGLASHIAEAIASSTTYDTTTREKVHSIAKELGEAIAAGGGLQHLHTLLFFCSELPMDYNFLSTLLEALTDVVIILKTFDVAINV